MISRGSSPGLSCTSSANQQPRAGQVNGNSNGNSGTSDPVYSRINKSSSYSLIKEPASSQTTTTSNGVTAEVESASLTWLQRQQKKLEERRTLQRRREGPHFQSQG